MLLQDKRLLGRRSIIETIIEQLKNISQIEHSRHRSVDNFFVNLIAVIIAYCHRPHKPSIQLDPKQYRLLISSFTPVLVRHMIGKSRRSRSLVRGTDLSTLQQRLGLANQQDVVWYLPVAEMMRKRVA